MDIAIAEIDSNRARMLRKVAEAAEEGANLVVFPECSLTGYCYESFDEAWPHAESVSGHTVDAFTAACHATGMHVVYGFLESDGDRMFNALALVGPQGLVGSYRKIHLPKLGIDRFVSPGDRPFRVMDVDGLRVGINICYDCSFPESSRVMALQGADLIVLPTNWPPGALCTADYVPNCRALENNIYFMSVNRIGTERGFEFIGKSKICDPDGFDLEFANHREEAVLYAEIDPAVARQKRLVRVPEKHEIHRMHDRRPDMYGPIVEPIELDDSGA